MRGRCPETGQVKSKRRDEERSARKADRPEPRGRAGTHENAAEGKKERSQQLQQVEQLSGGEAKETRKAAGKQRGADVRQKKRNRGAKQGAKRVQREPERRPTKKCESKKGSEKRQVKEGNRR